jgi:hypothetical protein
VWTEPQTLRNSLAGPRLTLDSPQQALDRHRIVQPTEILQCHLHILTYEPGEISPHMDHCVSCGLECPDEAGRSRCDDCRRRRRLQVRGEIAWPMRMRVIDPPARLRDVLAEARTCGVDFDEVWSDAVTDSLGTLGGPARREWRDVLEHPAVKHAFQQAFARTLPRWRLRAVQDADETNPRTDVRIIA